MTRSHKRKRTWKEDAVHVAAAAANHVGNAITNHFKHRHSSTQTRTITEKKETMHGDDVRSGYSGTVLSIKVHKLPKDIIRAPLVKLSEAYEVYGYSNSGQQKCIGLWNSGTMQQAIGQGQSLAGTDGYVTSLPFWNVQPDQPFTSSGVWGAQAKIATNRICLRSHSIVTDFANTTNNPIFVEYIVLEAKMDIPSTQALAAYTYMDPIQYWQLELNQAGQGVSAQTFSTTEGSGTLGVENTTQPGARPWESRGWKKYFKIKKIHAMHLGPMAVETVTTNISFNWVADQDRIQVLTGLPSNSGIANNQCPFSLLKGGLFAFMIVRGTPVDTDVNGKYTTAGGACACVVMKKTNFSFLKEKSKNYRSHLAVDALRANSVLTQKNIQSGSTGDVVGSVVYAP